MFMGCKAAQVLTVPACFGPQSTKVFLQLFTSRLSYVLRTGEYVERRHEALRDAIRRHGDGKGAPLALALVENATRAPSDAAGEKLLGNDCPWRPDAFRQVRHCISPCYSLQRRMAKQEH